MFKHFREDSANFDFINIIAEKNPKIPDLKYE